MIKFGIITTRTNWHYILPLIMHTSFETHKITYVFLPKIFNWTSESEGAVSQIHMKITFIWQITWSLQKCKYYEEKKTKCWEFVTSRLKKTNGTWQLKVMYKNQSIDWMLNREKNSYKSLYLVKDYTGACYFISFSTSLKFREKKSKETKTKVRKRQ